jgi:hypothetical protein
VSAPCPGQFAARAGCWSGEHYDRYGLGDWTIGELRQERRNLATGMAFLVSGSAARAPLRARLDAVDTELGRRPQQAGTVDRS